MPLPALIADGGELTVVRRLAFFVYGYWDVKWPSDFKPPELEEGLRLGYVGRLSEFDPGLSARRFIREDVSIVAIDDQVNPPEPGTSNVEEIFDTAVAKASGEVFFEKDITNAGLGRLRPLADFFVGDRVPVFLWGRILAGQLVTAIDCVGTAAEPIGYRVHVGGQVLGDAVARARQKKDMQRDIAAERRERLRESGETAAEVARVSRQAASAVKTADGAVRTAGEALSTAQGAMHDSEVANQAARSAIQTAKQADLKSEEGKQQAIAANTTANEAQQTSIEALQKASRANEQAAATNRELIAKNAEWNKLQDRGLNELAAQQEAMKRYIDLSRPSSVTVSTWDPVWAGPVHVSYPSNNHIQLYLKESAYVIGASILGIARVNALRGYSFSFTADMTSGQTYTPQVGGFEAFNQVSVTVHPIVNFAAILAEERRKRGLQ